MHVLGLYVTSDELTDRLTPEDVVNGRLPGVELVAKVLDPDEDVVREVTYRFDQPRAVHVRDRPARAHDRKLAQEMDDALDRHAKAERRRTGNKSGNNMSGSEKV